MPRRLRDGDDEHLTFSAEHLAWHWEVNQAIGARPTVIVGSSTAGGGTGGWEFSVVEMRQGGGKPIRVQVFDEAFAAFREIPGFFAALDTMPAMSLDDVIAILRGMGATDVTEYEMPARLAPSSRKYRVR